MTATGMNRFPAYDPPNRGGVDTIRQASDKVAASAEAIREIRQLVDSVQNHASIPSRRIRQILKRHGL